MVDIIVVTYRAPEPLERCLKAIAAHTSDVPYRVTVVANSGDVARGVGAPMPITWLRPGKNLGFSGAANLALHTCDAPQVALVDDDCEVTSGWLRSLGKHLEDPRVAIVGPRIVNPDGSIFAADLRYGPMRNWAAGEWDRGQKAYQKTADGLVGACWVASRKALWDIGPFDEDYFPCQYEDSDYCVRARLKGYTLWYDGTVEVLHRNLLRALGQERRNRVRFLKKWGGVLEGFPLSDSHPADRGMAHAIRCLKAGAYQEALDIWSEVQALDSRCAEPVIAALCYFEMGDRGRAARMLQQVLELNPRHSLAIHYLARLGEKPDLAQRALASFGKRYRTRENLYEA